MTFDPTSDRPPHRDEAENALLNKLADVATILVVVFTLGVVAFLVVRALL